jgi:hypothetical protein
MAITRLGPNQDITAAKIAGQINFKNLIINGDMSLLRGVLLQVVLQEMAML